MCDTDSVILCSHLHPYFFVLSSEKKLEEERERERKEQVERGTVFYPHINKVYSFLLCSQLKPYVVLNMNPALERSSLIF